MTKVDDTSAIRIASAVKQNELKAENITNNAIRMALTKGKQINAFITVCEEKALAQARAVDAKIKKGEGNALPLAGVPIVLKDNICYKDYPTTCASKMLSRFIPPYNATCVDKLIGAGAVIIGKTNMDEFAMGSSNETSYYGCVQNPMKEGYVPGGSSGGSATAVKAGIVPVALGSDTGGSVRQPAAFCGIYGLKPTYGSISRYGLVAFASSLDQIGPMAGNIDDLALIFSVINGVDIKDATSIEHNNDCYPIPSNFEKAVIGIPLEYIDNNIEPSIQKNIEKTIATLKLKGVIFKDISLNLTEKALPVYYIIASAEASSNLARYDCIRYGYHTVHRDNIEDRYISTRTDGFGIEVKRRIMLGTYVLSAGYYDEYYKKATFVRQMISQEFDRAFDEVDLIITPVSPTPPFKFNEKIADPMKMYLSDIFTVSANLAGIPAISVPNGTTKEGLPTAVQFIANKFNESTLFKIAKLLEEEIE